MRKRMEASNPRLIALGFYDGPIEGFVRGITSGLAYYFKAVAWDPEQDRRLFLLGQVEERVIEELLVLLAESGQSVSHPVLTPAWEFRDKEREALANMLVDVGKRALRTPSLVALGSSLLEDLEIVTPTASQLTRAMAYAQSPFPRDLGRWLALNR
jgi:hypothetical protein